MNSKSITFNDPYESQCHQSINISNLYINIKNKEYQENFSDIEKNISDKCIRYFKKNDEFESFLEYQKIFINPNNLKDGSTNQYQNKTVMIKRLKKDKQKKEKKEEEKEEEEQKEVEEPKILGRKRKGSPTQGKHTKYSNDNLYRKIKSNLLDIIYEFLNNKIIEVYKDNPNYNLKKDILRKIEQDQIVNSNIIFNQNFLSKTLKEIFSVDISHKYKCEYGHNRNLIKKLLEEKDKDKNDYFSMLFNLTFLDCLNHFRGTMNRPELEGIINFEQFKEKYLNDADYITSLDYVVMNYEDIIMKKKPRKPRIKK